MSDRLNVGVVGCGNICPQYFKWMRTFDVLNVVACADMLPGRAETRAAEFNVPRVCTTAELLASDDIQLVLNLTTPLQHTEVNLAAIAAGKHVYCEKPLAVSPADGRRTLAAARQAAVRVGCAPDTFLGGGGQTARKLIDDGAIGLPVAATAFFTCRGHERWHPDPEFYYKVGGGPMLDMGPYYLTALVNLLGPVARVTGSARRTFARRTITSQPKNGTTIEVEVPTHVAGVMDFAAGAVGTIITSFDVWDANLPRVEIYGTEGSLGVPDPNAFAGAVRLLRGGEKEWKEVGHTHSSEVGRGIGLADMATGILSGRPQRASGQLANHVLEVMFAFGQASEAGRHVKIEAACDRPAALPTGLAAGRLDE